MTDRNMKTLCYLANAGSIHTQRWANYFVDSGWDVHLVTWHSAAAHLQYHSSIKIHKIISPPHYAVRYLALIELAHIVRRINPDILHAHYISHFGILAALYAKYFNFQPLVLTAWGSDIFIDARGIRRRLLVARALQGADLITCDGESLKVAMTDLGADSQKIRIITHGVDTRKFKPDSKSSHLEQELFIPNQPIVISTRQLKPPYNVETLIRAVPLVLKEIPSVVFVVLGDGEDRHYLKDLTKSLSVEKKVIFRGNVPHDDLAKYLSISDIYVSTSLSDSTAVSNLEAMACGLAPIITDIGDNRRWIIDGQNGFLIPIKDPQVLAEKIILLLKDKEKRNIFGIRSRAIIEEKSDYYQEMAKMDKIYTELVARYKV